MTARREVNPTDPSSPDRPTGRFRSLHSGRPTADRDMEVGSVSLVPNGVFAK